MKSYIIFPESMHLVLNRSYSSKCVVLNITDLKRRLMGVDKLKKVFSVASWTMNVFSRIKSFFNFKAKQAH